MNRINVAERQKNCCAALEDAARINCRKAKSRAKAKRLQVKYLLIQRRNRPRTKESHVSVNKVGINSQEACLNCGNHNITIRYRVLVKLPITNYMLPKLPQAGKCMLIIWC